MNNSSDQEKTNFFKELITFAIVAAIIVIPIRTFIAQPFIVSGESMYPTFDTGQYLIIDQLSYKLEDPVRGDVIIFKYPQDPSKFFIKRIIGLPNEKIKIEGNNVRITMTDGTEITLDEPYVVMHRESNQETILGDDEYFVMGDNRLASLDSRIWGPLKKDMIAGRAWLRLLPVDKADFLPGDIN